MLKLQSNLSFSNLPECPEWAKETIMNRVNNWLFVSLFFFVISLGLMTFTEHNVAALVVGIPCLLSLAMALIRWEDYLKANDVGPQF